MNKTVYKRKPAFEYKECIYLFGKGGYLIIDTIDNSVEAVITVDKYKLRTPQWGELFGVQHLPVSSIGFEGMCEHLCISSTIDNMSHLKSYEMVARRLTI